jgi:hypothetical protein
MFTSSAILKLHIRGVFRRICTFAFLFGALTTAASGQHLAVGVKGGVPLVDAFEQNTPPSLTLNPTFFFHYTFDTKRYTVGPAVDVSLPLKLRFEADALYTRLDYDSTVMGIDTLTRSATRANSWQFPLLLKKEIPVERVQPFGDIGYALRHVSGTSHIVNIVLPPPFTISQTADSPELVNTWVNGFVVGGGVAFQAGPLKFSPEVRYTRWADPNFRCPPNPASCNGSFLSNLDQADFLLGIAWSRF